jgi:light-regulated signal transduction histidine kinase (bacteriophytochrome)
MAAGSSLDWFRCAPGWLCVVGSDECILEVSDDLAESLGVPREELLGCSFFDIAIPEISRSLRIAAGNPSVANDIYDGLRVNLKPRTSGYLPGRLQERPVHSGSGQTTDRIIQIQDLRPRDGLREQLEKKARQTSRSETYLSEFTQLAAHDLQEPLRKIKQFSNLLHEANPVGENEDAVYYLDALVRASDRMGLLIEELIEFSRARNAVFEIEDVSLNALITKALRNSIPASFDFVGEFDEANSLTVQADPFWLDILFKALFENSVTYKASDRSPSVEVTFESLLSPNGAMRVIISDNGIGFDPIQSRRIFEPFRRLHSRQVYPGTGMGLAIAGAICERFGWTIAATGELGVGARFTIEIPNARKET